MKKHISLMFVLVLATMIIANLGISAANSQIVLRLAQPQAIEHPQSQMVERIAQQLSKASDGQIVLKHYPAGQMGSAPEMFRQMVEGAIDFVIGGVDQAAQYYDKLNAFELCYLYKSPEHMMKVLTSPLAKQMYEEVRKKCGAKVLNPVYFGTRILSTKTVKAYKPADLKGVKIRATPSPVWVDNINALGCTAVPMPLPEVYMALQTGTVEGQDNPLPGVKAQKFYEVQNNFILTNHTIGFSIIMANESSWNRLPKKYQTLVQEVFVEQAKWMGAEITRQDQEIRKELETMGKTFIEPDRKAFRDYALNYLKGVTKDRFGDLIDKIAEID